MPAPRVGAVLPDSPAPEVGDEPALIAAYDDILAKATAFDSNARIEGVTRDLSETGALISADAVSRRSTPRFSVNW